MGVSMEDRIKSGPLMPRWQKIKSRHKALNGKMFKTDIAATFERYDQSLKDYEAAVKNEASLKEDVIRMLETREASKKEILELAKELDKINNEYATDSSKYRETALRFTKGSVCDLSTLDTHLRAWVDCADECVDKRKALFDEVDGTAHTGVNQFKKAYKVIGDKSRAILDQQYKINSAAISAEVEAGSILRE